MPEGSDSEQERREQWLKIAKWVHRLVFSSLGKDVDREAIWA